MVWYDIDTRELSSVYMIELSSVYIIPNHLGLRSPGSEYAAVLRRKRVCVHISVPSPLFVRSTLRPPVPH